MAEKIYAEPEIIPPRSPRLGSATLTDENLEHLAALLDDIFRLPGTSVRFGLDAIIGLVPAVGDLITSLASFLIIFAAWQRRLPGITLARMVANVAIDTVIGTVPIAGDMFDVAWKANRMNMRLLQRDSGRTHRQTWRDWLYLLLIGLVLLGLMLLPFVVLVWIVRLLWR
ncbi:MAG TPA: DUF4112 domain-containing protein [Terriglobales bacterium]|nr:DUF4112 domain-containing protein [Terriglobales bacterium]